MIAAMGSLRQWLIVSMLAVPTVTAAPGCRGDDREETSDAEIRSWYNERVATIPAQNQGWIAEGLSAEQRARRAYEIRHQARIEARERMSNRREVAGLRARDRLKYGDPDGPSFEYLVEKNRERGLEGDAVYEAIIESAAQTNEVVNELVE